MFRISDVRSTLSQTGLLNMTSSEASSFHGGIAAARHPLKEATLASFEAYETESGQFARAPEIKLKALTS
jgi:hypothetical protein